MNSPLSVTPAEEEVATLADIDIAALVEDREAFNALVYTDVNEAIAAFRARTHEELPSIAPPPAILEKGMPAAMFRQVFTPNYEIRRFLNITDALDLRPIFWEYHADKFTPNNEWKHALGKLFFYGGTGKKGGARIEALKIIDFNESNGRPINELKTLWGQSLIEFHHELLQKCFRKTSPETFDASEWFGNNGKTAYGYYRAFISLFVKEAILFENFMLHGTEGEFTRDIFLPAFLDVWRETGRKPLIVSLEPTDIEGDRFWLCYPNEDRAYVERKLNRSREPKKSFFTRLFTPWI